MIEPDPQLRPPDGSGDCPDENAIVGFVEGALSELERARIEAHCAHCEGCRSALTEAARDLASSRSSGPGGPGDSGDPGGSLRRDFERAIAGAAREAMAAEVVAGTRIGRFEVLAVQGRGQFGVVYRARDTELGRMVALKLMRRAIRQDGEALARLFSTEAAAAARLSHPNIVTLHDYGEHEGAPYLILELLEGETLRERLERAGRLASLDALAIAVDVARAAAEAHAAGVIHRDIKPSNVFLCARGNAKLLDLGLAQLHVVQGGDGDGPPAGDPGARAGTPRYMAPELFRGRAADACSDVYAIGMTLLDSLAGMPEISAGGDPPEFRDAPDPVDRPWLERRIGRAASAPAVRRLLRRATARDPADRFQRADELVAALIGVRGELAGRGRRVSLAAAVLGVVGAAVAAAAIASAPGDGAAGAAGGAHRLAHVTVAVLGFENLSGRAEAAWLATALAEMLDADLAASSEIRVVPAERVSRARADLAVPDHGLPGARMVHEVSAYLGVDRIVVGSYVSLVAAAGQGHESTRGATRIDVRLLDAGGQVLDSISETGDDGELLDAVARIGSRVRVHLAGSASGSVSSEDAVRSVRASQPANAEAIRLYAQGLSRWRSGDVSAAHESLALAVAADPEFPLSHSALSQVMFAQGEEAAMREQARIAFERSGVLRREERMLVEARYREMIDDWATARELRRTLHELFPDDLEYGLEFAEALDRHAQKTEALAVIAELRRMPPPWRDDPRIDLVEAQAQRAAADRKPLAIAAADKARALGARWALARALARESTAARDLGDLARSLAAGEESAAVCVAIGDRECTALAEFNTATTHLLNGDPIATVIAAYERALALEREIGNQNMVAAMLGNIAFEHLEAGEPARAAARVDELEPIVRIDDRHRLQAERLRAWQWLDQGELGKARALLESVRREFLDAGKGRAFELQLLGDVLLAQGEVAPARGSFEHYLEVSQPPDSAWHMGGLIELARLEVATGDTAGAEAHAREVIATCARTHDDADLAAAQALLAQSLVAERRFAEASAAADIALQLAARSGAAPTWIDAQIARAGAQFGRYPTRLDAALADARMALERARSLGLVGAAFEARLAAGEILRQARSSTGRSDLDTLAREAQARGFLSIARRARSAAAL